jgi:serine/threonine protein kinase
LGNDLEIVAKSICKSYNFCFVKFVDKGAFKKTYHVKDSKGQSLALKIFQSIKSIQRTKREIEAMQRCNHTNVAKLLSVDTFNLKSDGYLFLIEEFLSGGTLTKKLESGPLKITEVRRIGKQLIDAVGHIASHNLVHRDIKPDNIMFRADKKTPVLVDFGLVRDLKSTSLTKTWLMHGPGTPLYSAPEQLNNEKDLIDWRTDQFALGILLGITAFGIHPYAGISGDPNETVERLIKRAPINSEFEGKCINFGLTQLLKMVSQWPVGRYRNTYELAKAWAECGIKEEEI